MTDRPLIAPLAVAVMAFVAGLFVGWAVFSSWNETPSAQSSAARSTASDASSPEPTPPTARAPAAAPNPIKAPGGVRVGATSERIAADALAQPADFVVPTGNGTIRGTVRAEKGDPIADFGVVAFAQTPEAWATEIGDLRWHEIPLETSVRRHVRERRWIDATKKTARTGADGSYEIGGLADVRWRVTVADRDVRFRAAKGDAQNVKPGDTLDLVVLDLMTVVVELRMPDGSVPEGAFVRFARADGSETTSAAARNGRCSVMLRPGTWRATAETGLDNRFRATATVEAVRGMDPVSMQFRPRPGLVIDVKRPAGFEDAPIRYFVCEANSGDPTDDDVRATNREQRFDDNDRKESRRGFMDLAPGRWVAAAAVDGSELARTTVTIADQFVECPLVIPAPDLSKFVTVRISGPDGSEVARPTVCWEYRAERERATYPTSPLRRGPGTWLVRRVGPGDAPSGWSRSGGVADPSGRWLLVVATSELGSIEAEVGPSATEAALAFAKPAVVVVTVRGLRPGMAKHVAVQMQEGEDRRVGGFAVDSAEPMRLQPVSPGRRWIWLRYQVTDFFFLAVGRREVDLVPGDNPVEITVPPLHPLDVDLGTSHARELISISAPDVPVKLDNRGSVQLDASGRAKVDLLPVGRYAIAVGRENYEISVPETRTFKP